MGYNIRKMTYEDRFSRYYCANWKRSGQKRKRRNRRTFRRKLKKLMNEELSDFYRKEEVL